jgi:hypothetical protein
MNLHAKGQALLGGHLRLAGLHFPLHLRRTLHGTTHTGEIG